MCVLQIITYSNNILIFSCYVCSRYSSVVEWISADGMRIMRLQKLQVVIVMALLSRHIFEIGIRLSINNNLRTSHELFIDLNF